MEYVQSYQQKHQTMSTTSFLEHISHLFLVLTVDFKQLAAS